MLVAMKVLNSYIIIKKCSDLYRTVSYTHLDVYKRQEWSTDDGGKTYIFKLRDGVKFHNGETLKASDVVFTFNRMQGTTSSNNLYTKLESVEAVDDMTVKIRCV